MSDKTRYPIQFRTKLITVNDWLILHLPAEQSAKLPTRGMLMVKGIINNIPFKTLLEPDGKYGPGLKPSHWMQITDDFNDKLKVQDGEVINVELEPTTEWVEPEVPNDLKEALDKSPKAKALWNDITPLARWDWIRWIRAVKTEETRKEHIKVALDKLNKGMRRPCCFNRNACSEPYVANSKWALRERA